jgi:hypothetical protein
MKNTDTSQLPSSIETQLSELEARHKAHQAKMEEQRRRKITRREAHYARRFINSTPPIVLV